jgi:D-alanine transaminase
LLLEWNASRFVADRAHAAWAVLGTADSAACGTVSVARIRARPVPQAWEPSPAHLAATAHSRYHLPMSRIAYVNGRYKPLSDAHVHIEDRGFQFADGVYEVVYVHDGRLVDTDLHLTRLDRSLRELAIAKPVSHAALRVVLAQIVRRNRLSRGLIYIQNTRGAAPRAHAFPAAGTPPSLIVTMRRTPPFPTAIEQWQGAAITLPDQRWARCDIKSTALLPNILAKQAAVQAGAVEAILYDAQERVTEGSSTSVFIVDAAGTLITRPLSHAILPGCTRAALIADLTQAGVPFQEREFSLAELRAASEVFITAASTFVKPMVRLDGTPVGQGTPGPVARRLFAMMARHVMAGRNKTVESASF